MRQWLAATAVAGLVAAPLHAFGAIDDRVGPLAEVEAAYDFVREDFANLVDSYGDAFPRLFDATGEADDMPIATKFSC